MPAGGGKYGEKQQNRGGKSNFCPLSGRALLCYTVYMKAILIENKRLIPRTIPDPVPADGEVLIDVRAAALNRADLLQREGNYPPPPGAPDWPGLEVAGFIKAVTPAAAGRWRVGDRVCALLPGGGYAELVAAPADMVMPAPENLSLEEAACLPEAFATAYLNLFIEGGAAAGDTLLMHAGASGLASVIIPMAKAFGLYVITSVLSADKKAAIAPLGADVVIDTSAESVPDALRREAEAGHPVDIAIDCLGDAMLGESLAWVNRGCRWIIIATLAGDTSVINMRTMYMKGIRLIGSTLRSKPPEKKAEILAALVNTVWPKIEAGLLKPTVYAVLPLEKAEEAQQLLYDGKNVGKVVLLPHTNLP